MTSGEMVFVGDSRNDVMAARAANTRMIAVTYGYNQGEDIRRQEPDAVVDQLSQIEALL